MKVALGTFACSGIETHLGSDIPATVRVALVHYADKLKAGRKPIEIPPFLRDQPREDSRIAFDLTVDAEAESLLEREAARQGATVSQLAAHSVMVYLAELDFLSSPAPIRARTAYSDA